MSRVGIAMSNHTAEGASKSDKLGGNEDAEHKTQPGEMFDLQNPSLASGLHTFLEHIGIVGRSSTPPLIISSPVQLVLIM